MAKYIGTDIRDKITGSKLADEIYGLGGNDVLNGSDGSDKIYGGDGGDKIYGGIGNDSISGESGTDLIYGGDGNDSLSGGTGNDSMFGGDGNDVLSIKENTSVIEGWEFLGGIIEGNNGNDKLYGSNLDDYLTGGSGADIMVGGKGDDIFDFYYAEDSGITISTRDIIKDFMPGHDLIDLTKIDANSFNNSGDDAFVLIDSSSAFWAIGQIRFDASTHILSGNIDKDFSTAEFSIKLLGVTEIQSFDFIL